MNQIENITRYWIDKDSGLYVRKWNEKEEQTIDPHTHIFEKYWSYRCPICSFIPTPCGDKEIVKDEAKQHELRAGNKHKCIVEYRDHELVCLEFRDEFLEDLGVWIKKQEIF